MNYNEIKLSEIVKRNNILRELSKNSYAEQVKKVRFLIREYTSQIVSIRKNKKMHTFILEKHKHVLVDDAKNRISQLNDNIRDFELYLKYLSKENERNTKIHKMKVEKKKGESKVKLNSNQSELLDSLLLNGSIDSDNIIDIIKVWIYMIEKDMFITNNREVNILIKFINDYNLNASPEMKQKYEVFINQLDCIITKKIRSYPKDAEERVVLKYNKKFINPLLQLNKSVDSANYDYRYDILDYFLNDEDCFIYLKRMFDYDPALFNLRDRNNSHIFNNIIKKYILSYKKELENHEKVKIKKEYYEQIIKLFVSEGVYTLNAEDKSMFEFTCKYFEDYLKNSKFKRENVLNALNSIKNITNIQTEENNYQKEITDEDIYGKYGIIAQQQMLDRVKQFEIINKSRKVFGKDIYTFMINNPGCPNSVAYSISLSTNGHIILSIHTPDIETLIPLNSAWDKSLYNKMFSMNNWRQFFPKEILEKLELNLTGLNPCMTYQVELLSNGKIGNSYFLKSNVMVTEKLNRDDINSGKLNSTLKPFIQASYLIDSKTDYVDNVTRIESTYSKLINYVVGYKFEKNKIPFIYTNQLPQNEEKFIEIISNLNYILSKIPEQDFRNIYKIICDDINISYYDTKSDGHSELNAKYRSDILNPLNSYLGIMAQRLVTEYFICKNYTDKDRLNTLLELRNLKNYANEVKETERSKSLVKTIDKKNINGKIKL